MASHQSSELSEVRTVASVNLAPIFTQLAAVPAAPDSLTPNTRHKATRHPVVPPKSKRLKLATPVTSSHTTPSIVVPDESVEPSEDGISNNKEIERPESEAYLLLPTSGLESSIFQTYQRQREQTS